MAEKNPRERACKRRALFLVDRSELSKRTTVAPWRISACPTRCGRLVLTISPACGSLPRANLRATRRGRRGFHTRLLLGALVFVLSNTFQPFPRSDHPSKAKRGGREAGCRRGCHSTVLSPGLKTAIDFKVGNPSVAKAAPAPAHVFRQVPGRLPLFGQIEAVVVTAAVFSLFVVVGASTVGGQSSPRVTRDRREIVDEASSW